MTGVRTAPVSAAGRLRARARRVLRLSRGRVLPAAALAVVMPLAAGLALQPVPAQAAAVHGPVLPGEKPVPRPVRAAAARTAKVPVMKSWHRPATVWPGAGAGTAGLGPAPARTGPVTAAGIGARAGTRLPAGNAALGAVRSGEKRAGSLPVWAGQVPGTPAARQVGKVTVTMAPRSAAAAAGIRGVIFTVARAAGTGPGRVQVNLDYAGFAAAYGGNYAARLRLVTLPACALTTPQVPACRRQDPLGSADDVKTSSLGADITVPARETASPVVATAAGRKASAAALAFSPAATATVVAATSSPSGSAGNFTATSLSEAGQWTAGGSDGAFTYSYPITVPPVPGGLEPKVSLGYDSQVVDGLTSSTNNQASWIGDGWGYDPGYIERDYASCGTEPPGATNWTTATGDFCWSSADVVTLSLDGQDTTLVQDASTGAWHAQVDNGEKITYQSGTSNGTSDGGYWVITEPDGTSYYFGLNELPGWSSGDTATNSTWTMPVYATSSGQPCYNATFADSECEQAWRWNLDYVTDPHGNAIAYFYDTETNYYAEDNGTTADGAYTQGGALAKIEYGLRAGSVYSQSPAAEVDFTAGTGRTDIPSDLACSSGASCDVNSPTFWDKYELDTIATYALDGSSLKEADSWALAHSYPDTGDTTTSPSLWLDSVTRTGQDGTAVSLPPVSFAGTPLPNRIETAADLSDGYSIITRLRLTSVTNETGGITTVNYLAPSGGCTSGSLPAPDANTLLCYPDYWQPSTGEPAVLSWFNKYVTAEVTAQDTTGNQPDEVTSYSYSGAAWHYDDSTLTRSSQRTWDQWRGFRTVTTETGPASSPDTETTDTYFQGMNGDYQADGSTASVSLTSSQGQTVTDSGQFAGMDFEHVVYDGPGGAMVTDTVTIPWTSAATATQSRPSPLPALTAYMTGTAETYTYTALAAGGNREATVTYTHDSYGRVTEVSSVPDTTDPAEDTCTTTSYASNTSKWIMDLPAEVAVVSVPCGTTASLPADAVSDVLTFYDGATSLSSDVPTAGNVTETRRATSYSGSAPVYTTESTASYDEYGRVLTSANADGDTTTTAYTPATGAEPTSVTVTDPAGLATTTTYDPLRELPLTVTTPAGWTSTREYDALGRLTAAWTDGHGTGGPAEYKYSYDVSDTAPSVVTTQAIEPSGTAYLPSETLYDSLGQAVETQAENAAGNTVVTDTYYNAAGQTVKTSGPYYVTGAPTASLVQAPDDEVPSQSVSVYDGAGRVTAVQSYSLGTETWQTDTAYGGNYTTTTYQNLVSGQPDGGIPQTVFTNGEGQVSAIYQYHSEADAALGPSAPAADYDATSYAYTPAGKLASITDAAGNTWTYAYNLAGDQVSATDPDAGTTASTYDPAGLLTSATSADGTQVSYTYDADGRTTAEYNTTGGAAETSSDELASWVWDTEAKGELTSSTSYYGGAAYTIKNIGYDGYGLSEGTETIIPSAQGALAGTYIHENRSYNAYDDQLASYIDSANGGLPQETVGYSYDNAGNPTSVTGTWAYVDSLAYTNLGQPKEYTYGSTSEPAWTADTYSPQTGNLTQQETQTGTTPVTVDDQNYSYDNTGQITADADTPSAGQVQVQCYTYDYLGRLAQAWSQGSAGCSAGPSQSAEAGAAAPYWQQYSYNTTGDMTSEVSTPASGPAVTTTDTYPAAGSARPHAITAQAVTTSSGTATTSYGYDAAGQLTSETGASSDSLTWNPAGQLAAITTSAGTTSYLYDASGNLLIQKDPATTTLYLPDEELVLDNTAGTVTGTRYYSIGGQAIAARTSAGNVYYLTGNQEGTATLAINSATLAVTERFYDPYGNPAGTAPGTWPGNHGFQNGTADTTTGLTNLGAREYNPATASFISPDPLLKPTSPQDLNAYAYAQDSPPTGEDPTGQMICDGMGHCGSIQSFMPYGANYNPVDAGPSFNPAETWQHKYGGMSVQQVTNYYDGKTPAGTSDSAHSAGTPVTHESPRSASARWTGDCTASTTSNDNGGGNPVLSAIGSFFSSILGGERGICGSGLAAAAVMVTGSACLVGTFNPSTGEVQIGGTLSSGGGLGMFGAGGGIGFQRSNAERISQLGGPFGLVGGSVSLGPDVAGDVFTGQSASNKQITGADAQVGVSADLDPNILPMWEIHGGVTYTWQSTFVSFNLYHA